mmetsp:Transcript_59757/g.177075  ORF Transcript_59757/g.177075 Transcript_59757/m.177075 type:complete len:252 (+) Transcript_59757:5837-6592(+)
MHPSLPRPFLPFPSPPDLHPPLLPSLLSPCQHLSCPAPTLRPSFLPRTLSLPSPTATVSPRLPARWPWSVGHPGRTSTARKTTQHQRGPRCAAARRSGRGQRARHPTQRLRHRLRLRGPQGDHPCPSLPRRVLLLQRASPQVQWQREDQRTQPERRRLAPLLPPPPTPPPSPRRRALHSAPPLRSGLPPRLRRLHHHLFRQLRHRYRPFFHLQRKVRRPSPCLPLRPRQQRKAWTIPMLHLRPSPHRSSYL